MADYGRDTDIGRPDDELEMKKAALALQAIADLTIDSEDLGEPEESD